MHLSKSMPLTESMKQGTFMHDQAPKQGKTSKKLSPRLQKTCISVSNKNLYNRPKL